jgi:hypothetical protein
MKQSPIWRAVPLERVVFILNAAGESTKIQETTRKRHPPASRQILPGQASHWSGSEREEMGELIRAGRQEHEREEQA